MILSNRILIDASPDVVWAVTTDVERWPEWTPTVTSLQLVTSKPFGLGSIARIKQPMQPEGEWVVTEFSSGHHFAWEARRPGLRLKGMHELEASGAGTSNVLRVEARGVLAIIFWPLLRFAMKKALSDENRGLKARCEQED